MHLLLLVVSAIAIAALGSARFALAFGLLIIAIPLTVRGAAHVVSGVEVLFGDAARAVTYSAGFALVFIAALLSAGRGNATLGPLLLAALLAAYTGGSCSRCARRSYRACSSPRSALGSLQR